MTSLDMKSNYDILTFCTLARQCTKFGKKMCKECKLALEDRFYFNLMSY